MPDTDEWQFHPAGLFYFGWNLARLQWALETWHVVSTGQGMRIATFMDFFRQSERIPLVKDIGTEANRWYEFLNDPKQSVLQADTKTELGRAISRWRALADERLQTLWLLTPTTTIQPKKLMAGVGEFLGSDEQKFIGTLEWKGLSEACGCILCDSPTAAEFITLRTAEHLLRRWHSWKTGKPILHSAWGQVFDELAKEYPPGDSKKPLPPELDCFGYLKLRRDRLGHPEAMSTLTEAEATLLQVCILVGSLQKVMSKRKSASRPKRGSSAP